MNLFFDMMGFDWIADIDYKVISWGSLPSWYDPGDPLELEVNSISISLDKGKAIQTPEFEATGELFNVLHELLFDKLYEEVSTNDSPDLYNDY